jgi:hypothetical protein
MDREPAGGSALDIHEVHERRAGRSALPMASAPIHASIPVVQAAECARARDPTILSVMFDPSFTIRTRDLRVTLFTATHVIRATVPTHLRRMTDVLNQAEHDFIIVANATVEEIGSKAQPRTGEFAQVNLASLLFAVAQEEVEPTPELRLQKSPERALIVLPPFLIAGRIHVLPGRELRVALSELTERFIPVTDAEFWSDTLGEPSVTAPMLAFNRAQADILLTPGAPDTWAGR